MSGISYKIIAAPIDSRTVSVGSGAKYLNSAGRQRIATAKHVTKGSQRVYVQPYKDGEAIGAPVRAKVRELPDSDVSVLIPVSAVVGDAREIAKPSSTIEDGKLIGAGGFKGSTWRPDRKTSVIGKQKEKTIEVDNQSDFNKGDSGMPLVDKSGKIVAVASALVEQAWATQLGSGQKNASKVIAYDLRDRRLYQDLMAA